MQCQNKTGNAFSLRGQAMDDKMTIWGVPDGYMTTAL